MLWEKVNIVPYARNCLKKGKYLAGLILWIGDEWEIEINLRKFPRKMDVKILVTPLNKNKCIEQIEQKIGASVR